MDIDTARVFAEAFSGVGEGATWAFVCWVFFDFLKTSLPYAFSLGVFFYCKKPAKEYLRRLKETWG